jgi:MarR family transcriptional regulator, 2-MHQ and catechol-resistance regulon repressor
MPMGTRYQGSADEIRALDAFIKLMRASDRLTAELTRQIGAADLTMGQFGVLEALLHLGPMCQQALGAKLLRSGSHITVVIDNLEKRQLVRRTRREDDRRMIDVALTPKGRTRIRRLFPAHARRITQLFAALTAAEQRQLGDLCRTLGKQLHRENDRHE